VEWRPSHTIKGAKYTSDRKQRFAMRDSTMSIYTHKFRSL
jgi:hypothetical protein